ncbi:MAG: glycerol-3-phosphate dehydrogenase [Acidimicrobiaceae bacterium]|nr:glycerol-3-phosphate dehydrogenase [Acidimicrobiaceae bacterium]
MSRERADANRAALRSTNFDLLVVGGGIVGAGIALDAATRGLSVAVVEAQDWAAGTSSRSSKLIHGGLRYLQMHDFALVREALTERSILLRTAPHLVHPLPFLYPLHRRVIERAYVGAGVLLYDLLARTTHSGAGLPFHRQLTRHRALALAPALAADRFVGAVSYYDGQVDDARHTFTVLRTAASYGAITASRACVVGLLRNGPGVVGARASLVESGEELEVRAKVVVGATGVWTEQLERLAGKERALQVQPSKGVHLVVRRSAIDSSVALILPTDRSVLFVLPWGEHWLIGTTDTAWDYDPAWPAANRSDIDYLLATVNGALNRPLERSDVEAVYVGLRPLIAGAGDETTKLSREHAVNRPLPGLVLVSGGKYTTYRVMARDTVDAAVEHGQLRAGPCRTDRVLLVGAQGLAELSESAFELAQQWHLDQADVVRLLGRYGNLLPEVLAPSREDESLLARLGSGEPSVPGSYLRAEVAYAVTHEDARHLEDVLERRTRLAIESRGHGAAFAEEIAEVMATRLGWDAARRAEEVAAVRAAAAAADAAFEEPDDRSAAHRLREVGSLLPLP